MDLDEGAADVAAIYALARLEPALSPEPKTVPAAETHWAAKDPFHLFYVLLVFLLLAQASPQHPEGRLR